MRAHIQGGVRVDVREVGVLAELRADCWVSCFYGIGVFADADDVASSLMTLFISGSGFRMAWPWRPMV